jgi:hypothetical protein
MSAPKIPDGPEGQSVREAFAALDLDPENPDHWFAMLKANVACTTKTKRVGAPKQWTDDRLMKLVAEASLMRAKNPALSVVAVSHALAKRPEYRKFKPATLHKLIYGATSYKPTPAHKEILSYLMANYKTAKGDSSRKAMVAWMRTGVWRFDVSDNNEPLPPVPRGLVAK